MVCREIVNHRLGHGNESRDNPLPALMSLRILDLTNNLALSTAEHKQKEKMDSVILKELLPVMFF
jgi:hypothetical protein